MYILPRKCGLVKPFIDISFISLAGWLYLYEAHFECHDILMLGKSPMKLRYRPDMTISADWDVKCHFKQNKQRRVIMLEPEVHVHILLS